MSDDLSSGMPARSSELSAVLSAAAMQAADAFTIEELGIPGFTLMETAGREAARLAAASLSPTAKILILAGKGNNGGDGLVMARWLMEANHTVEVFLTAPACDHSPDAATNLAILQKLDSSVIRPLDSWTVPDLAAWQVTSLLTRCSAQDLNVRSALPSTTSFGPSTAMSLPYGLWTFLRAFRLRPVKRSSLASERHRRSRWVP